MKKQADLVVMIVLFLSGLLVIISTIDSFGKSIGSIFTGASIMFSSALICRAIQWASEGKQE
jgi:hypothetical protein